MIRVQKLCLLLWLNGKRYSFENVFFDMVTYLPFGFPSAMFTSHLLSKHRDKHCHRVSKWQKGFTFADVYLFLISIFFILIIEEIALQYEGLGFKKLSPICRSKSYSTNFLTGQPNFIYSTYMKLGWSGRKFVLEPLDQF